MRLVIASVDGLARPTAASSQSYFATFVPIFRCGSSESAETIPLTQERHRFLVRNAIKALDDFLYLCSKGSRELVIAAESLRVAMHALGKITGEEVTTDEMLDVLFRDFCIGK